MPLKGGKMSRQEQIFAEKFATTGDQTYAAAAAGYGSPRQRGYEIVARPAVQAEIARQQQERLFSEALPAAVQCLISIATDVKAAAGARVQASKVILDRTLGLNDATNGKEPHEMTPDEIARAIEALERMAADRARLVVDASPIDEAEQPEALDIMG